MIDYTSFTLDNGLKIIVHEDPAVQIAIINILYDVGSRDEDPEKTGFAHLFEHLMFGGSQHIANYDGELQKVGGQNNAFTSPDITNYYMTLPAQNLETGFWLESDRMLGLSFDPNVLEIQRKVVIEEFKQRYLNQPYGDVWLKLRPLAYQNHPYQWPTIGKDISHVENATMDNVRDFFYKYYVPSNAIMVVAGNVKLDEVKRLSKKWFEPIPAGTKPIRRLPVENKQISKRTLTVGADVPADALYMTYHTPGKFDEDYHVADLASDILGRGKSSRLYQQLVVEKKVFNTVGAYLTGSLDPGLMVIHGKTKEGVSLEEAESEVNAIIHNMYEQKIDAPELQKVKNQAESTLHFSNVEVLNRAMSLAMFTLSGDTAMIRQESEKIQNVTSEQILEYVQRMMNPENSSILYYRSKPIVK